MNKAISYTVLNQFHLQYKSWATAGKYNTDIKTCEKGKNVA